ncbi:hypothetical protein [Enhygromyxa salina]|uniref:Uncharacterized protein n=1 Tax=Enhygromyxa salina TaxID=215803 RepID=A0A2S9XUE4_9BACT|nr:hypothetical protein [Enhygromyxa salina]PRP96350.1 hypothetical protein ENSA7_71650 [Enhygromyxa salina]
MTDRQLSHRSRTRLVPIASLVVIVGLTAGLGLGRTVWGAPPADSAADSAGEGASPAATPSEAAPGADASAEFDAIMDADPTSSAATPPPPPDAGLPPAQELPETSVPGASTLRGQMESGMSDLGELAVEARNDADLVRATCVLDKQDRANDVMDLGTSELLVIRDPGASEQARGFALEKLEAAANRIDLLVEEAKACTGQEGPEDEVDIVRNQSDEPQTVPMWDPSLGLGHNPVPPPLDGGWPPVASPIE